MLNPELRRKITQDSISLETYGLNELAWSKENAKQLIKDIMKDRIGILGGDVYKLGASVVEPLYANWSCEPAITESEDEYFLRSKLESLMYIEDYYSNKNEGVIFSITFSERIV